MAAKTFVTHLEAAIDGTKLPCDVVQTLHADRPLWVRYDLPGIRRALNPDMIAKRPPTLWRYRELLPLPAESHPITLGEGMSPLLPAPTLGASLGLRDLWIKDESQLPTGSFKSRGLCMA
ncbi:MAG: pyridoxal-phosphate dependent enzyme, partial [Planctomycetes bacterium]|nr:pyridoxal-phosphate dependent enzyme [Planctomycetota bacterium]